MSFNICISPEAEAKLKAKAAVAGLDVATYAAKTLERLAFRPSLEDVLAPLQAEFDAAGMSEAELTDLLEQAKHEARAERPARGSP